MSRLEKLNKERQALIDLEGSALKKFSRPDLALGVGAGRNIESTYLPILSILIGSLIAGILSVVALSTYNFRDRLDENLLIAMTAIAWFVFVNFIFLLIQQTRILNMLLFLAVIIIAFKIQSDNRHETGLSNLMTATGVLAAIPFVILLRYWFSDYSIEIAEIRTAEQIRKYGVAEKAKITKYVEKALKEYEKLLTVETYGPLGGACEEVLKGAMGRLKGGKGDKLLATNLVNKAMDDTATSAGTVAGATTSGKKQG